MDKYRIITAIPKEIPIVAIEIIGLVPFEVLFSLPEIIFFAIKNSKFKSVVLLNS